MIKLSIIISYYKAIENLKLILEALNYQSSNEFEAIISEDDNNEATINFLNKERNTYNFQILHVNQQKDDGFRKNVMLNKSIKISNSETLVFIDGDCIPHKHFVKSYINNIQEGVMLKGRRVMLGEKISEKITTNKTIKPLNTLSILLSDSDNKKEGLYLKNKSLTLSMKDKGLLGCNWGIQKKHLIEINGFDEDYIRAAVGEDSDIEWRLKRIGIGSKSMKNKAIVYHIHHERGYSEEGVEKNMALMKDKMDKDLYICLNGLEKRS
ncbi:glycosyltransferase [Tenacibaculum jejuense]|uniref:Glycosyl transferase, group 2 family protein n=1 Tax=Tenacibaculum jejuense TaxID=584609 RepID=A0A238U919_9FLAO|nr:glycosyltransferase [Tenacibaculum jejuense]SNR15667.1 Glycosyl transferase, group 2 family protein [Tenacibaculum jejuense]